MLISLTSLHVDNLIGCVKEILASSGIISPIDEFDSYSLENIAIHPKQNHNACQSVTESRFRSAKSLRNMMRGLPGCQHGIRPRLLHKGGVAKAERFLCGTKVSINAVVIFYH